MSYKRYSALIEQYKTLDIPSIDPRETKESLIQKLIDISHAKKQILVEANDILRECVTKYEKEPALLDGDAAAMLEDFLDRLQSPMDFLDAPISLRISRLLLQYHQSMPQPDPEQVILMLQRCAFYDVVLKEHQDDYESTPYAIMAEPYMADIDKLSVKALGKLVNCLTIGGYNLSDLTFGLRKFSENRDAFDRIRQIVGEDDFMLRYCYATFKINALRFAVRGCFRTEEAKKRGLLLDRPLVDLEVYAPVMEEFRQEIAELTAPDRAQELLQDRINLKICIAETDFYLGKISLAELFEQIEECSRPQEDHSAYERSSALLTTMPCYLDYLCVFSDHDRQYVQDRSIEIIRHVLERTEEAVKELSEESRYSSELAVNNAVLQMIRTAAGFLDFDFSKRTVLHATIYANKELYVHTMMVKEIALVLLEYILDHDPEYLDGVAGHSWEHFRDHRQETLDLMENCALLHDIGKYFCLDIVNNSSRALTDDEFEIIKEHPTNFSKIYPGSTDPQLQCIRDCAELHHLWYNETGGYPRRTHTVNKPFVNLLTIADCIDAATDNIGRPYGMDKTLEQVMAEFDDAKDTRYSGYVSGLLHIKAIKDRINYVIHDRRREIYCEIYLQNS